MRCLVPTRLAEAAIQRRGAALQLHAVAEWCRARGRRRRERPFASLLSVAAKALGLLARPLIAPGQARCHCGTYAVHERRSGGPRQARCGGAARVLRGFNYGPCRYVNQTLTLRVARGQLHVCLQSWRICVQFTVTQPSQYGRFALNKSELHRVGVRPSGPWAGSTGRLRLAMSSQWRSPGCRPPCLVRRAHAGSTEARRGQTGRAAPDRQ